MKITSWPLAIVVSGLIGVCGLKLYLWQDLPLLPVPPAVIIDQPGVVKLFFGQRTVCKYDDAFWLPRPDGMCYSADSPFAVQLFITNGVPTIAERRAGLTCVLNLQSHPRTTWRPRPDGRCYTDDMR